MEVKDAMLRQHPHIKFMTGEIEIQSDGGVRSVAVFYTDLELSNLHPGYDANAVEELIGRIHAYQKDNHQPVRLRTIQPQRASSWSIASLLPKNMGRGTGPRKLRTAPLRNAS